MNSIQKSHAAHARRIDELVDEQDARLVYIDRGGTQEWRERSRTLELWRPFWQTPGTWLTVADNNGFEAHYLQGKGQEVTASDISDALLREAHLRGGIAKFRAINAEAIDFPDDSFDYVSCREAFHHFPRAYRGLYEMVRVARKAALMIEPADMLMQMPELLFLKNVLDRFDRRWIDKIWKNHYSFETVGNYVFKISEREVEKMAMGMGLPCVAFKPFNAAPGVDPKRAEKVVRRRDVLCRMHLAPYVMLCCAVFKQMPDEHTIQTLREMGYKIIPLPKNPYL
jgi:ubiquinone/menaquinone biosynthesis C-methylase UbiE